MYFLNLSNKPKTTNERKLDPKVGKIQHERSKECICKLREIMALKYAVGLAKCS